MNRYRLIIVGGTLVLLFGVIAGGLGYFELFNNNNKSNINGGPGSDGNKLIVTANQHMVQGTPSPGPLASVTPSPTPTLTITPTSSPEITPAPTQKITTTSTPILQARQVNPIAWNIIPPENQLESGMKPIRRGEITTDDDGEAELQLGGCNLLRLYKRSKLKLTYCSRSGASTGNIVCLFEGMFNYWDDCKERARKLVAEVQNAYLEPLGTWYVAGYSSESKTTMVLVFPNTPMKDENSKKKAEIQTKKIEGVRVIPFWEDESPGNRSVQDLPLSSRGYVVNVNQIILTQAENRNDKLLPPICPEFNKPTPVPEVYRGTNPNEGAKPLYECLSELKIDLIGQLPRILEQYRTDRGSALLNEEPQSRGSGDQFKPLLPVEPPRANLEIIDFVNVAVTSNQFPTKEIKIENPSNIEITLSTEITGQDKSNFEVVESCQKISPAPSNQMPASCLIRVKFRPQESKEHNAELIIGHNADASGPLRIPLKGKGILTSSSTLEPTLTPETVIKPSPDAVDFAIRNIDEKPVARIETSISGTRPIEIIGISLGDPKSPHYEIKQTSCNGKVIAQQCFIDVEFKSDVEGLHKEKITIKAQYLSSFAGILNQLAPLKDVVIQITGEKAFAMLDITSKELCFDRQKVIKSNNLVVQIDEGAEKTFTLINSGKVDVKLGETKFQENNRDFVIVKDKTTCVSTIKPGDKCEMTIGFTPRKRKIRSDKLLIFTNTKVSRTEIKLNGVGKPRNPISRFYYKKIKGYKLKPCL